MQSGEIQTISQFPSFKKEILENNEVTAASVRFTVQAGNETIYDDTPNIEIYASDSMIWTLDQPFDVSFLIVAWVTPSDPVIGEILKIAKEKMPDRTLMGYQRNNEQEVIKEVEIIWYTLRDDIGISYVNSTLTFAKGHSQRVRLPRVSFEEKSANCIDGTVLMASVLESLGIETTIMLVPGHAFLLFALSPGGREFAIETTLLGSGASFLDAVETGIAEHNKSIDEIQTALGESERDTETIMSEVVGKGYVPIPVKKIREKLGITPLPIN